MMRTIPKLLLQTSWMSRFYKHLIIKLQKYGHTGHKEGMFMPVKMTKNEARKLANKTIKHSKKYGIPLKRKK